MTVRLKLWPLDIFASVVEIVEAGLCAAVDDEGDGSEDDGSLREIRGQQRPGSTSSAPDLCHLLTPTEPPTMPQVLPLPEEDPPEEALLATALALALVMVLVDPSELTEMEVIVTMMAEGAAFKFGSASMR